MGARVKAAVATDASQGMMSHQQGGRNTLSGGTHRRLCRCGSAGAPDDRYSAAFQAQYILDSLGCAIHVAALIEEARPLRPPDERALRQLYSDPRYLSPAVPSRLHVSRRDRPRAISGVSRRQPYLRIADHGVAPGFDARLRHRRPQRLNPEIGTEADFRALVNALHTHSMGLILDFVPNHMGVGSDNLWWLDVLEWGRNLPFAAYFDINWDAVRPDLKGRVLLPVLGDHYGVILEKGEIALRFDSKEGSFSAWYYQHCFPISPRCYAQIFEAGGQPLTGIGREFSAIDQCPATSARERAAELNIGSPNARPSRPSPALSRLH